MNPIKILVLTANPTDTGADPLRLDAEVRRIEEAVQRSRYREHFQVIPKLAVRAIDLRRALLARQPIHNLLLQNRQAVELLFQQISNISEYANTMF